MDVQLITMDTISLFRVPREGGIAKGMEISKERERVSRSKVIKDVAFSSRARSRYPGTHLRQTPQRSQQTTITPTITRTKLEKKKKKKKEKKV
jgi:hypothetical protein